MDKHRVVARTFDDRYVTVKELTNLDWREAQRKWNFLDNQRRAGKLPLIAYLVVRSEQDPDERWRLGHEVRNFGIAEADLAPFVVGRQRGFGTSTKSLGGRGNAAKAWGKAHGYEGYQGGWIYKQRPTGEWTTVGQGWDCLVYATNRIVKHDGRYYWNDLDLVEAEEVA